jgi:hypothetical protein
MPCTRHFEPGRSINTRYAHRTRGSPWRSKPWTISSYDDAHPNEALLGSFVPRCFLGTAPPATKDLAIDFDADGPDRGGDRPLGDTIVVHPLDLAPRFLKLLVEQCQMARRGGRSRCMRVVMVAVRRGRPWARTFFRSVRRGL